MVSLLRIEFQTDCPKNFNKLDFMDLIEGEGVVEENMVTMCDAFVRLEKLTHDQRDHLHHLQIRGYIIGKLMNKVLIDRGTTVNLIPRVMLKISSILKATMLNFKFDQSRGKPWLS